MLNIKDPEAHELAHALAPGNRRDCFAYALAKSAGEPLLFKGEDFRQTDVVPAL